MSDKNQIQVQIGPGFLGTLTIVLVLLKALGYIDISWWWAFAPVLLPLSLFFGFLGVALIVWMIMAVGTIAIEIFKPIK